MGERFGQALRQWRKAAGLSQPQLARQVLLGQSNVSRLENGKLNPDGTVAEQLDEVLGAQGQLRVLATGDVSAEVDLRRQRPDRPRGAAQGMHLGRQGVGGLRPNRTGCS
jgi:transcriptional regulator with XRE-family HTH domain